MARQRQAKPGVMYARLQRAAERFVRRGELRPAIDLCERALAGLPKSDYERALGHSWMPQTKEAARWLAAFYRQANKSMDVKSLYCEMTRFEINTDVWNAEAFAYERFGDLDEPGWLAGWKNSTKRPLVLAGTQDLQRVYARDQARKNGFPPELAAASEAASMLLTLRFQELIQAAAIEARAGGKLPEDVPVLAAVHDSDLLFVGYGKQRPQATGPKRPRLKKPKRRAGGKRHIYRLDIAWDEHGNSLPFHCLDFGSAKEETKSRELLRRAARLSSRWKPPRVKLRKRKWQGDTIYLPGGTWAVTSKGKALLEPLLGSSVEFLPLLCRDLPCWALHPLKQIALGPKAVHDGRGGSNITEVEKYDFHPPDLIGLHLFQVQNAEGSPARRAGSSCRGYYCSTEFRDLLQEHGIEGASFKRVFSYIPRPSSLT